MQKKQIVITIKPNGKVESEVSGVTGKSCADLTKFLDQLGQVTSDEHTPDYYNESVVGVSVGA